MEGGGHKDEVIWGLGDVPRARWMAEAASCYRAKKRFADDSEPTTTLTPATHVIGAPSLWQPLGWQPASTYKERLILFSGMDQIWPDI